jgi:glutathione synthase/RimK-type ligase-like ATP-grasp enzyme
VFGFDGSFHPVIISLMYDKELTKKLQSKLFWYDCFTENKIKTPKVYYHLLDKPIKINELSYADYYILKPNYGTQGKGIKRIKIEEITNHLKKDLIVQEYIKDCYTDHVRHFRISTISHINVSIFGIEELIQYKKGLIVSNHSAGGSWKTCENMCEHLSESEQTFIETITTQLVELHKKSFEKVPLIGWDVCLTCNGPYVFEGNLGASIGKKRYKEYLHRMSDLFLNPQ